MSSVNSISTRAFSNYRDTDVTITGAAPSDARKAFEKMVIGYEARLTLGETFVPIVGATIVLTGRNPFIVYRLTGFTADFLLGAYTATYDTSAPNNESLP